MNLHGFQIKKALVIFILIIAAGMAIQYFLYQSRVINPLGWELAGLPGVLKAEVVQKGLSSRAPSTVHLTLAEDVPLSLTFQGIWRALEEAGG
ncbi:MAG TPA: hypothetical protein GX528_05295, partial [Firmicutes bacterium]|nr:hypothetical protein [Bacillota bacterium]